MSWILGRNFMGEVISFAILAAVFSAVLMYLPVYPDGDYWGKVLNNFLYFTAFYVAARWAFTIRRVMKK
jgi:hypothetical protein